MTKFEFLGDLSRLIADLPQEEVDQAMEYYEDYFADAGPEKEQEIIRTYIPPCFFQRDFRPDEKSPSQWIRKPIWGREGRGIDIINEKGETLYRKEVEDPEDVVCRDSESSLVQQYIPQQKIVTKTDVGILEGYVTLSCFMLGDRPSAIYARFSEEKIAGNEAYWIPVLYEG